MKKLELFPGAATSLACLPEMAADSWMDWYQRSEDDHVKAEEIQVAAVELSGTASLQVAFFYHRPKNQPRMTVLDVGSKINLDEARERFDLINRTDWQKHMLTVDIEGLTGKDLLTVLRTVVGVPKLPVIPLLDPGFRTRDAVPVFSEARRWGTALARQNFRQVLDHAAQQPQIIERGGDDDVMVVSRKLYEQRLAPRSAVEVIQSFRAHPSPRPPRLSTETESPRRLNLPPLDRS